MFDRAVRWLATAGIVLLASCGGGGGGGGSDNGPSLSVTSDKASLQFRGFANGSTVSDTINFTVSGGKGTYYGLVTPDQPGSFSVEFTPTSETSASMRVTRYDTGAGQRSGSIAFKLCADAACHNVAWSRDIPYTSRFFSLSASSVVSAGYEGVIAAPVTVGVSPPDVDNVLVVTTSSAGVAGWLSAERVNATAIEVRPTGVGLSKGTHEGAVQVSIAGSAATTSVPVSFTVGDGLVPPAAVTLEVTAASTPGSVSGSAQVSFQGTQAPAWTATSNRPWLVMTQSSGSGQGSVSFSVDTDKVGAIGNWSSDEAQVTLAAAGVSDSSFRVILNKKMAEVTSVTPNVAYTGRSSVVRIRGRGFDQLSGNRFRIGNYGDAVASVISPTEAIATLPALATGDTTVAAASANSASGASATVTALPITTYSYAAIPTAGDKQSVVFDPVLNRLYAVDISQSRLVAYTLDVGTWVEASRPVTGLQSISLPQHRRIIYASILPRSVAAISPSTLDSLQTYTLDASDPFFMPMASNDLHFSRGLPLTTDGRLWFSGQGTNQVHYFDTSRLVFGTLPSATVDRASFYGSADGGRMIVSQSQSSPRPDLLSYAPSTSSLSVANGISSPNGGADFNLDGSKILFPDGSLYDSSTWTHLGTAVASGSGAGTRGVVSPDGTRIYLAATTSSLDPTLHHIDVLDTTKLQPGTNNFVNVGQIALTDQPADCTRFAAVGCAVRFHMAISPLGDVLFLVGDKNLVVIPIPHPMSGLRTSKTRLLRAAR